jgi:PAS domain S-box-containing protein
MGDILMEHEPYEALRSENDRLWQRIAELEAERGWWLHTERVLRERELAYRTLVEHSLQGLFIIQDGRNVFVNPAAATITGYTIAELLGMSADELIFMIHPDDRAVFVSHMNDRMAGQDVPPRYEFRILCKNGEERWLECFSTLTEHQGCPAIQMTYIDNTERKRAEEALRESQVLLYGIMDNSAASIFVKDLHGRFLLLNRHVLSLFQMSAEQMVGKTDEDFLPPEVARQLRANDQQVISAGIPMVFEEIVPFADGNIIGLSVRFPIRTADGTIYAIGGISTNITEHKQLAEALRISEERFRMLAENARDIIFRYSCKGPYCGFEYISPSVEHILGYTPEEYYANPELHLKVIHPESQAIHADILQNASSVNHGPVALRHTSKNGHDVWLETHFQTITDEAGNLIALEGISRDITERKRLEDALQQAKETAEAATRAKSDFLANMSHEIRTPLNAIIGMTSLLLDTKLALEQQDYVQTIRVSSDLLLTLINDVLDFSKIESGKLEIDHSPFNLRTCIEDALELVAPGAAEKGLNLAYFIEEGTPEDLIGDSTCVRQIIVNLLSNAVKFTHQGEVVISVGEQRSGISDQGTAKPRPPTPDPRPPHDVHIRVRDTGIGIPPERLDRLFKSFSQVDTSTTREYGGTGLGLAISKRLAEAMGGTISVASEPGKGSTFQVTLLVEQAEAQPRPFLAHDQPALKGKRALLVSDNATNRAILARYLERWGLALDVVNGTSKLTEYAEQALPRCNVVVLDVWHANKTSVALAGQLQTRHTPAPLPIIIYESMVRRSEIHHAAASMTDTVFLMRPIRPGPLYESMSALIQQRPLVRQQSAVSPSSELHTQPWTWVPLRILLAEDNVVNQKVALHLLEKLGYHADVAANGQEALEVLRRSPYDIVLMDVQMPQMDGIETTRSIRKQWPDNEQPYIIAMTAHVMEGDREWCLAAGMDDYIGKPVRFETLVEKLKLAQQTIHFGGQGTGQDQDSGMNVVDAATGGEETAPLEVNEHPSSPTHTLRHRGSSSSHSLTNFADGIPDCLFTDMTDKLALARKALKEQHVSLLSHLVHTLALSCTHSRSPDILALCEELYTAAMKEDQQAAALLVEQIEAELSRARAERTAQDVP